MDMDPKESARSFVQFTEQEAQRARERYAKLLPYMDGIKTLRDKGWQYKEIAEKLKEYGVNVKPQYLSVAYRDHFKIRARRRPTAIAPATKVKLQQPTSAVAVVEQS